MSLELFKSSLQNAPIVKKGGYSYFIHPITDGIPEIKPEILQEITQFLEKQMQNLEHIDKIVTIEAMGIPIATCLSQRTKIPFTIIRKKIYNLPDEICVHQKTGYSESKLSINGIKRDEKVIIVDDVLSTGGTLRSVLSALKSLNVDVKRVFIAVNKSKVASQIEKEFNVKITTLIDLEIINGRIIVK